MRDENNFIFSEKFLHYYVASLRLLRALVVKCMQSYSICGKINPTTDTHKKINKAALKGGECREENRKKKKKEEQRPYFFFSNDNLDRAIAWPAPSPASTQSEASTIAIFESEINVLSFFFFFFWKVTTLKNKKYTHTHQYTQQVKKKKKKTGLSVTEIELCTLAPPPSFDLFLALNYIYFTFKIKNIISTFVLFEDYQV